MNSAYMVFKCCTGTNALNMLTSLNFGMTNYVPVIFATAKCYFLFVNLEDAWQTYWVYLSLKV